MPLPPVTPDEARGSAYTKLDPSERQGFSQSSFDGVPNGRNRQYGDPTRNSTMGAEPTKDPSPDLGAAGLSKGVISTADQEAARKRKAATGTVISNDDL